MNGGLTKADLSTRLFSLAIFLAEANVRRRAEEQNNITNLTQLLEDLRVRLDDGYVFTREQMVCALKPGACGNTDPCPIVAEH